MSNTKALDLNKIIIDQFTYRQSKQSKSDLEHAVLILKPGFNQKQIVETETYIRQKKLTIVYSAPRSLSVEAVLAIYSDIFRYNSKDNLYGDLWKFDKLKYMISGRSYVYVVRGENAVELSGRYKQKLRKKYGKLSIPSTKLTRDEFSELAIKNVIHVVDSHDTEVALWLLRGSKKV